MAEGTQNMTTYKSRRLSHTPNNDESFLNSNNEFTNELGNDFLPTEDITYDLGAESQGWKDAYIDTIKLTGAIPNRMLWTDDSNILTTEHHFVDDTRVGINVVANEDINAQAQDPYAGPNENLYVNGSVRLHGEVMEGFADTQVLKNTYAHAEGRNTLATGLYSHAEGYGGISTMTSFSIVGFDDSNTPIIYTSNIIMTDYAHYLIIINDTVYQIDTISQDSNEQDMCFTTTIDIPITNDDIPLDAKIINSGSAAIGLASHVEGSETQARSDYAHAEGYKTQASDKYAHAEGNENIASGEASHAEGYKTQSSNKYAHAEGNENTASGNASHAEGAHNEASGTLSHVEGYYTIARSRAQHVFGYFNIVDENTDGAGGTHDPTKKGTYVEIVGNGTTAANRDNARTLTWTGTESIAGNFLPMVTATQDIGDYRTISDNNNSKKWKSISVSGLTGQSNNYTYGVNIGAENNAHIGVNESSSLLGIYSKGEISFKANCEVSGTTYDHQDGINLSIDNTNTTGSRQGAFYPMVSRKIDLGKSDKYFEKAYIYQVYLGSGTANRLVWTDANRNLNAGYHYADSSHVAINSTTAPTQTLYVSGTTGITGALTLLGTTAAAAQLNFSRAGLNYITWPSTGDLALCPNATVSSANSTMVITSTNIYPGKTDTISAGTDSYRWQYFYGSRKIDMTYAGEVQIFANNTNGMKVGLDVTDANGGIWDYTHSRWMIYSDKTNGDTTVKANSAKTFYFLGGSTEYSRLTGTGLYVGTTSKTGETDIVARSDLGYISLFQHGSADSSKSHGVWVTSTSSGASAVGLYWDQDNTNLRSTVRIVPSTKAGVTLGSVDLCWGTTYATQLRIMPGSRYKYIYFTQQASPNTVCAFIEYDSGHVTNISSGRYYFVQYSPNSTADTGNSGYYESYRLPTVATGLTANKPYDILTTKATVSIAQGGTGTTTADGIYAVVRDNGGDTRWVKKAGDTMTGNLTISKSSPQLVAQDTSNNNIAASVIVGSGHINHGLYSNGYAPTASTFTSSAKWIIYRDTAGDARTQLKLYGAVWNDYAEFRATSESIEPGRCITETGNDSLKLTTKRLERGCEIVSDTYGFAIGETDNCKTPIASSGRVLAYPYESREEFAQHIGWPVCSGPNGTVSIMTEEEEEKYPSRIIGTISAVPDYETWGSEDVAVNGRVWIRIR